MDVWCDDRWLSTLPSGNGAYLSPPYSLLEGGKLLTSHDQHLSLAEALFALISYDKSFCQIFLSASRLGGTNVT